MIDIALSNKNSQGIQKILDEQSEDLQQFLRVACGDFSAVRSLMSLMLSEHFNCQSKVE